MKSIKIILSVFMILFLLGFLTSDSIAVPKKLIGMWRVIGTCEFIGITFHDNSTFVADRGMDNLFSNLEGTYEVHGRTITLNVTNDPRMPAVSPAIKLRSYKVNNDILTFTMNGKKCKFERTG